jgi:hypothetical protein
MPCDDRNRYPDKKRTWRRNALVTATVGIAFGHQTEIAAQAAGAVVMEFVAPASG